MSPQFYRSPNSQTAINQRREDLSGWKYWLWVSAIAFSHYTELRAISLMSSSWCYCCCVVDAFFPPLLWHLSCRMSDLVTKVGLESPKWKTSRTLTGWEIKKINNSVVSSLQRIAHMPDCICCRVTISEILWICLTASKSAYCQRQHLVEANHVLHLENPSRLLFSFNVNIPSNYTTWQHPREKEAAPLSVTHSLPSFPFKGNWFLSQLKQADSWWNPESHWTCSFCWSLARRSGFQSWTLRDWAALESYSWHCVTSCQRR